MDAPNIDAFCRALRKHGANLLNIYDPYLRQLAEFKIRKTDICYSDSITASLECVWDDGAERGVEEALESFLHEVRERLDGLLGPDSLFPWSQADISPERRDELYYTVDTIQLVHVPESIAALIAAACMPLSPEDAEPGAAADGGDR